MRIYDDDISNKVIIYYDINIKINKIMENMEEKMWLKWTSSIKN